LFRWFWWWNWMVVPIERKWRNWKSVPMVLSPMQNEEVSWNMQNNEELIETKPMRRIG
jgi:hypothetical protein